MSILNPCKCHAPRKWLKKERPRDRLKRTLGYKSKRGRKSYWNIKKIRSVASKVIGRCWPMFVTVTRRGMECVCSIRLRGSKIFLLKKKENTNRSNNKKGKKTYFLITCCRCRVRGRWRWKGGLFDFCLVATSAHCFGWVILIIFPSSSSQFLLLVFFLSIIY